MIGSTGVFNPFDSGTLTGPVTITGNLTVNGNFTFGDAVADTLTVNGVVDIVATAPTTQTIVDISDANALTTGTVINVTSNSSSTATRNLVYIQNDHASATGTTCLSVQQDSTGAAATFTSTGDTIVRIDGSAVTDSPALILRQSAGGSTTGIQLDDSGGNSFGLANGLFMFTNIAAPIGLFGTSNQTLFIRGDDATILELGINNVNGGAASNRTIRCHNSSGSNIAGSNLTVRGGASTGSGTNGDLIISATQSVAAASTVNSLDDRIHVYGGSTGVTVINEDGADHDFRVEGDTVTNLFTVDAGVDSIGIGNSTFDGTGRRVLAIGNGTEPGAGVADVVQFYSIDDAAGHTIPAFRCEGTNVIATGQSDSASSVRVKMRINGTTVTLLAI